MRVIEQSQRLANRRRIEKLPHFIYALTDQRDGLVRYVGVSHDPNARLKSHAGGSCQPTKDWIAELRSAGLAPAMVMLCGPEDYFTALKLEAVCIKALSLAYPLLNRRYGTDEQDRIRFNNSEDGRATRKLFMETRKKLHHEVIETMD